MSNGPKKKYYVSLGFHELDLLKTLGWGERAMYLELKRMSNFKTGEVGVFRNQALSWEELGRLVSVPSAQGRAAKLVDGKEAALMVGRLEAAGLVSGQGRRENKGLTLMLPLSPIGSAPNVAEPVKAAQQASTSTESATQPIAQAQQGDREDTESSAEVVSEDWGNEHLEIQSGAGLHEEEAGTLPETVVQPFSGVQPERSEHIEPAPVLKVDWEENGFPVEYHGDAEVDGVAPEKVACNQPDSREDAGSIMPRMPDSRSDEIHENLCSATVSVANEGSESLLKDVRNKIFFETNPGAGDSPAPCPPQASIPTPIFSEKSPGAVRASLTLADIRSRLAADRFLYPKGEETTHLMQQWIDRGISLPMFEKAIEKMKKKTNLLTPRALNGYLMEAEKLGKKRVKFSA